MLTAKDRVVITAAMLELITRKATEAHATRVAIVGNDDGLLHVLYHQEDDMEWRMLVQMIDAQEERAREIEARRDQLRRCEAHIAAGNAEPRLRDGAIEDMRQELERLEAQPLHQPTG